MDKSHERGRGATEISFSKLALEALVRCTIIEGHGFTPYLGYSTGVLVPIHDLLF